MSKSKVPKEPLTPKGVHRLLVEVEKKGDLRGAGICRVLTKAIEYGMRIIAGSASDVEIEAFWSRLYLAFTEIEEYHRKLDAE